MILGQTKSIKSNKRLTKRGEHEKIKSTVQRREISKVDNTTKVYHLINHQNGATMVCTENYLTQWLARGFEVVSIEYRDSKDPLNVAVH